MDPCSFIQGRRECPIPLTVHVLNRMQQEYWEPSKEDVQFQSLTSSIRARAIRSFCHATLALLKKTAEHTIRVSDSRLVVQILRTRVLAEVQALDGPGSHHAKEAVCHLILEVMMLEDSSETSQWSVGVVSRWYRGSSDMVGSFENLLRRVVSRHIVLSPVRGCSFPFKSVEQEWKDVLRWLSRLLEALPHDVCQKFLLSMIPSFNEVGHGSLLDLHFCSRNYSIWQTTRRLRPTWY